MQQEARTGRAWFLRVPAVLGSLLIVGGLIFTACGDDDDETNGSSPGSELSGNIDGDGSSTVFPITEAVAEEFGKVHDVDVTVGISGTGGGFEKFCNGETDYSNASRAIKDEEAQLCATNSIGYEEFEVAYDGLSIVVSPANDFAKCLTVDQLKAIWAPDSAVSNWNQVDPSFPDQEISLYGPGTDSGTFDYFTAEIVGEEGASRADYTASEDDNVLVQGVTGDDNALGYFGFAYYEENKEDLNLVAVDGGTGCVQPSKETILDGSYAPLSRPLYVYVASEALSRPEVSEFMRFYLTDGRPLVEEAGYVQSPEDVYTEALARIP
jgi:phosphate transport system substrate-binding protein